MQVRSARNAYRKRKDINWSGHYILGKYQQYRRAIKAMREREEKLSDIREKKRSLQGRISNLTKSSPKSPKLREFTKELESLERDTRDTEMEMSDFKRFALREAFYIRFNAMHEMAEKLAIIAGFGKYIVDLLDIEPTPHGEAHRKPYEKGQEAAQILADALIALESWHPMEGEERPTLADQRASDVASVDTDADDLDKGKGKQKPAEDSKPSTPPALPPRSPRPQQTEPTGYSPSEVAHTTGDLKINHETEIDLAQLDLYGPPPAYEANDFAASAPSADQSPLNAYDTNPMVQQPPPEAVPAPAPSAPPAVQEPAPPQTPPRMYSTASQSSTHKDKILQEDEENNSAPFQTPISASRPAPTAVDSPVPSPAQLPYTQSPQPYNQRLQNQSSIHSLPSMHQHQPFQNSISSAWSEQTAPAFYHTNYSQLYRQFTRRQKQAPPQRPYSEFQQQYRPGGRVDAGGFRIPPRPKTSDSQYPTADEEKQALAQRYGSN